MSPFSLARVSSGSDDVSRADYALILSSFGRPGTIKIRNVRRSSACMRFLESRIHPVPVGDAYIREITNDRLGRYLNLVL